MSNHDHADIMRREGLSTTLGIELQETTPERVVATMPVTPQHHQLFGFLYGGASVVLAETRASIGGSLNCPPGKGAFGLEINANHVRPVRDGVLTAIVTPLYLGRVTHVWDVRVTDERDRLVCVSRCTVAVVDIEP